MTAEIGILNKHGIALAADSAVTIGGGRGYYNTANKLFALSKYEPIAIMIYSNASMMGYPVEIIVKEYRKKLGKKSFDDLIEYWDDFLEYLKDFFMKNTDDSQKINYYYCEVASFLEYLHNYILNEVNNLNVSNPDDIAKVVEEVTERVIDLHYSKFLTLKNDDDFKAKEKDIEEICFSSILELINGRFGFNPKKEYVDKLKDICIMLLTKKHDFGNTTGIVITGFGDKNIYPKLISGKFMGVFFNQLKFKVDDITEISDENTATIIPFAQIDVVNTFTHGYDSNILNGILKKIEDSPISKGCTNKKCINDLKMDIRKEVEELSRDLHWGPMVNTVAVAPKEELAHMAETLVNLTSFRRKLSLDNFSQTVGGPIDVILLTKGDGLIWIKRKFYFDPNLNYNFFHNYNKERMSNEYIKN